MSRFVPGTGKFKLSNNPKIGNLESTLIFSIICHPFVLGLSSPL